MARKASGKVLVKSKKNVCIHLFYVFCVSVWEEGVANALKMVHPLNSVYTYILRIS